jgi:hypothetical protein
MQPDWFLNASGRDWGMLPLSQRQASQDTMTKPAATITPISDAWMRVRKTRGRGRERLVKRVFVHYWPDGSVRRSSPAAVLSCHLLMSYTPSV